MSSASLCCVFVTASCSAKGSLQSGATAFTISLLSGVLPFTVWFNIPRTPRTLFPEAKRSPGKTTVHFYIKDLH